MDYSFANGGGSAPPPGPDGPQDIRQGQAALLLVESLMHELLEKGVLSREEFVQVVDGAAEVEHELIATDSVVPSDATGSFLYPLSAAFRRELEQ